MILPCRTRSYRNHVASLRLALLLAVILQGSVAEAIAQNKKVSSEDSPIGWLAPIPLEITAGVDFGYDDHVLGSTSTATSSGQASLFAKENLVLSYNRGGDRTQVNVIGIGRFTQFFDAGTDDKDGNITLSLAHNFTRRLSLYVSAYNSYQTEPDFGFDVGSENVRADHFFSNDIVSLTYHWLPRLAFVTSYAFQRIMYIDAPSTVTFQDRLQQTISENIEFNLTTRTKLIGQYRFEYVDYDTAPRDSTTNFLIGGFEHHLTEHLRVSLQGGESFRSFKDDGDRSDPYAQGIVQYDGSNHSLLWITSYRVEEPSVEQALVRTTIRTGVKLNWDLTSRLKSSVGLYYHHDDNDAPPPSTVTGAQDSLHFSFGLTYMINKHFSAHLTYEHNTVSSIGTQNGYSRNRYFGGVTYTY